MVIVAVFAGELLTEIKSAMLSHREVLGHEVLPGRRGKAKRGPLVRLAFGRKRPPCRLTMRLTMASADAGGVLRDGGRRVALVVERFRERYLQSKIPTHDLAPEIGPGQ